MANPKSHSGAGNKTFKYPSGGGNGGVDNSHEILPAYANVRIKEKTVEGAMEEFRKTHGNSDHEWAYVIDNQGFAHKYVEGNPHSVQPGPVPKGSIVVHNHPSGNAAFSGKGGDLERFAKDENIKAMAAVGSKETFLITKSPRFNKPDNVNKFMGHLRNVHLHGDNLADAMAADLTQNSKRFNYKFTRIKNK